MDSVLQSKCDLLVDNKEKLAKAFAWDSTNMLLAASLILTNKGITAEPEQLKAIESIVKEKTGALSEFRGNIKIPMICKMLISGNPEAYFDKVEKVYKLLNTSKWMSSTYKILAAMTICDYTDEFNYEIYVTRTNELYKRMKETHKWLTSEEDIPFAAILAVSDIDVEMLVQEMEACYKLLKGSFMDSNAVQSLSHVLALGTEEAGVKAEKVMAIFDSLKKQGHKFGSGYELSTVGSLAMLEAPVEETVSKIIEIDEYLKQKKGFGNFTLGASERRYFAAQLLMEEDAAYKCGAEGTMLGSMVALTVATEVAIMICVTASVNAANH